ncbi:spermatogenesis-associated serine-rich protein 2 [Rhinophrynus dorsalis]
MSINGIGGVCPAAPMSRVYHDWGVGKGLWEVGVSEDIPINVLLGNDLGRMLCHYAPEDTDCKLEGLTESPAQSKVLCESLGDVVKCDRWEGVQGMDKCLPVTEPVMPSKGEVGCFVKCDYNEFQMPKHSGEGQGRGFGVPQVTIKDEGPGVSGDLPVSKSCETVMSGSKREEEWDFPSVTCSLDEECREQRLCYQEESGRQRGMPMVAAVTCQQYARAAAVELGEDGNDRVSLSEQQAEKGVDLIPPPNTLPKGAVISGAARCLAKLLIWHPLTSTHFTVIEWVLTDAAPLDHLNSLGSVSQLEELVKKTSEGVEKCRLFNGSIQTLLDKEVLEPVPLQDMCLGSYSNLSVVSTKDSGCRPVLDLKYLNSFVVMTPYHQEPLRTVLVTMSPGEFLAFLDLLDERLHSPFIQRADPIGFVFDVQSNTVMAQGGSYENMKEKINAVRAVVPNKSNNEIILVLQHFDNCVDRTVQAFMEGNAVEVLKEWTVLGKKKNKKKKSKPKVEALAPCTVAETSKVAPEEGEQSTASSEKGGLNGYHINGSTIDTESVDSLSECMDTISLDAREMEDSEPSTPDVSEPPVSTFHNGRPNLDLKLTASHLQQNSSHQKTIPSDHRHTNKVRSGSVSSSQSLASSVTEDAPSSSGSKKLGANIEKSVKDLQRCSVSLARYRMVVKEEMDASIKKMKLTFSELQSCLMDREVALLAEMDKVKAEAMGILDSRQKKAEELKKLTDVAVRMSEEQLAELRADIKHFVSERKYDEELGRAARFTADLDTLKKSIESFGQVSHPKNNYSTRSRCCSLTSPSDTSAPSTPDISSMPSFTSSSKKPTTAGESPNTISHYGSRPGQPPKQGFQQNKKQGQGYRQTGPRQNYSANNMRYDSRNRNNSWYHSNSRNQSYHPQAQRQPTERTATYTSGSNGPAATSESIQTAVTDPENNALPQRKQRANPASAS